MRKFEKTSSGSVELAARGMGLFIALVGTFGGYEYIWTPIQDALAAAPRVELNFLMTSACPALLVIGTTFIALGSRAFDLFGGSAQEPTKLRATIVSASAVVGGLTYVALRYFLHEHGYAV